MRHEVLVHVMHDAVRVPHDLQPDPVLVELRLKKEPHGHRERRRERELAQRVHLMQCAPPPDPKRVTLAHELHGILVLVYQESVAGEPQQPGQRLLQQIPPQRRILGHALPLRNTITPYSSVMISPLAKPGHALERCPVIPVEEAQGPDGSDFDPSGRNHSRCATSSVSGPQPPADLSQHLVRHTDERLVVPAQCLTDGVVQAGGKSWGCGIHATC